MHGYIQCQQVRQVSRSAHVLLKNHEVLDALIFNYLWKINLLQQTKIKNMEPQNQEFENMKNNRVGHLQKMLDDQKRQLLKKVSRHNQAVVSSKKYRSYRNVLQQRVLMADNFIKNTTQTFFTMLSDKEFLMLTTEIDVIQKVQRFKKNIFNSLQKITLNLESKSQTKIKLEKKVSHSESKVEEDEDDEMEDQQQCEKPKGRAKTKSKNFKISSDATRAMMEWLLVNFENPYPTTEQKQVMARQGKISMIKVNNWFINARQRTVKSYFQRDN